MPINFFDAHHTQSNKRKFGLYDKPHPAREPSYIMEEDDSTWIGIVNNPNEITADFYGLDHSLKIPIPPPNPENKYLESLCDGLLEHQNNLAFVELKERDGNGKWIGKSTDQIINAIRLFASNHDISAYRRVDGHICNKLKPAFHTNCAIPKEKFREASVEFNFKGELIVQQAIDI